MDVIQDLSHTAVDPTLSRCRQPLYKTKIWIHEVHGVLWNMDQIGFSFLSSI